MYKDLWVGAVRRSRWQEFVNNIKGQWCGFFVLCSVLSMCMHGGGGLDQKSAEDCLRRFE